MKGEGNIEALAELTHSFDKTVEYFAAFRRQLRAALYPYWPSNPAVTDDEIVDAVRRLMTEHEIGTKAS